MRVYQEDMEFEAEDDKLYGSYDGADIIEAYIEFDYEEDVTECGDEIEVESGGSYVVLFDEMEITDSKYTWEKDECTDKWYLYTPDEKEDCAAKSYVVGDVVLVNFDREAPTNYVIGEPALAKIVSTAHHTEYEYLVVPVFKNTWRSFDQCGFADAWYIKSSAIIRSMGTECSLNR